MLGKSGERMLISILSLLSFAVLVQIFTVEYLDLRDIRMRRVGNGTTDSLPNLQQAKREKKEKEEEEEDNPQHEHKSQKATVLEDIQLRDLDDILSIAGADVNEDERNRIPSKEGVVSMYGSSPVILGLERCEEFRRTVEPKDAFIAPAGMFNTGTNLLQGLLMRNCHNPAKMKAEGEEHKGIRGQVPWGKHRPVTQRFHNTAGDQKTVDPSYVLGAAIIKDPYTWMNSMCRHSYEANWFHDKDHCPNLVPLTPMDFKGAGDKPTVPVKVRYSETDIAHYDSLVDLWNDWYSLWVDAKFPRLVVRFEDLLFHAEEVTRKICECGGGVMFTGDHFRYIEQSAKQGKPHKGSNGLVKSVVSYGNETQRVTQYRSEDLDHAKIHLSRELMDMFRYSDPIPK